MYWTPPLQTIGPPLLKSDDLFFREPRDIGPPPLSKILDTPLPHVLKIAQSGSEGLQLYLTLHSR